MRKILLFLFTLTTAFLILHTNAYAITPSDTPSPSQANQDTLLHQINQLKDKIASRVAQLKLVEKRGIIGSVTDTNNTQITLKDRDNITRYIDVDEITKFTSLDNNASFGISDLKKGVVISVLGTYNKDSERILARFVDVIVLPSFLSGAATDIDKVNNTFNLLDESGKKTFIDVANVTKTYSVDTLGNEKKTGFSKIMSGERVTVLGYPDKKNTSHIIPTRILLFPDYPGDPKIAITMEAPSDTPSATPLPTGKSFHHLSPTQ